jgi:hypothetical protein
MSDKTRFIILCAVLVLSIGLLVSVRAHIDNTLINQLKR